MIRVLRYLLLGAALLSITGGWVLLVHRYETRLAAQAVPRHDAAWRSYLQAVYGTETPMRQPSTEDWQAMRELALSFLPTPASPMDVVAMLSRFYHLEAFGTPWMPADHQINVADQVSYLMILHMAGILKDVPRGHEEKIHQKFAEMI